MLEDLWEKIGGSELLKRIARKGIGKEGQGGQVLKHKKCSFMITANGQTFTNRMSCFAARNLTFII